MLRRFFSRVLKSAPGLLLPVIVAVLLLQILFGGPLLAPKTEMTYTEFKTALRAGQIQTATIGVDQISGTLAADKAADATKGVDAIKAAAPKFYHAVRVDDPDLLKDLEANQVNAAGQVANNGGILALLGWILPLVLLGAFGYLMLKSLRGGGAGGPGGIFSFGKSKARVIQGEQTGVTFKNVGGAGEAVSELQEITEYLKDPARFQRLGGRMTKGVILVGSPGTGKTLLAKATAGEAGAPFFSVSASEFVEMFVGVGASRVRDLFEQAKKAAPSIIFIDELDAIGGRRAGAGAMGAHEEREQTLNQLLAEMDGFESQHGVIVMAATNRPEVLDPALLRPGRFDRQITVDLPDLVGRQEILSIHARPVTLAADVDLQAVARITPGFSGADLENVVNQAALAAARDGKDAVEMVDFDEAIERVVAGSERRTRAMNPWEKQTVAVHEAGHALVASLLPGTDPVHKVTIVPRGRALGYTIQRPIEDRYLLSQSELRARLAVMLGGRAAEALTFDEVSTGASDDLARATDLARRMATEFGMSPALGPVRLAGDPQAAYLGPQAWGLDSRVSQETASQVDAETRRLVEEALDSAAALLSAHRTTLERLAERLCEHETVNGSEVTAMLVEASMAGDGNVAPDGSFAPDGGPWQDASLWHVWNEKTKATQDVGLTPKGSATVGKAAPGNGHQPTRV
jgi:cell division protease FtsH